MLLTSHSYNKAKQPLTVTYSDEMTPNVAYACRSTGQQATMVDGTATTAGAPPRWAAPANTDDEVIAGQIRKSLRKW